MEMKIFLGQSFLRASFCYDGENCLISMIRMKIFLGQSLLLIPLCYYIVSILRRKIFLGQNFLIVLFWFCE